MMQHTAACFSEAHADAVPKLVRITPSFNTLLAHESAIGAQLRRAGTPVDGLQQGDHGQQVRGGGAAAQRSSIRHRQQLRQRRAPCLATLIQTGIT